MSLVQTARESGHQVYLRAGEQALDLLGRRFPVERVRSIQQGFRGVLDFPARLQQETRFLRILSPDLVVSDGDAPALVAARYLGLPAMAVGHDLVFSRCRLPPLPLLPLLSCRSTAWMASATRRAIAVHFLPAAPLDEGVVVARPVTPPPGKFQRMAQVRWLLTFGMPTANGFWMPCSNLERRFSPSGKAPEALMERPFPHTSRVRVQ
ncbi:MAG: hypothetical protein RMJ98_03820 [Myxococcales bacterium]|nr:hypothetical protein [Myxococcales bacterium]